MADSCIVLNCSCESYVQAPSKNTNRGTLLSFKTSCDSCHHAREEHRPLTELDRFIQAEFAIASRNPCTGQIPIHQVAKTSLFGGYDLIPVLNDDPPNELEGEVGVPCLCSGFQYPNSAIVSIMQRHRSSSRDRLNECLPLAVCSHCSHPLSNHQWTATHNTPALGFIADNTLRIKLHSSVNLNRHIGVSDFGALVDIFFEDDTVMILAVIDSQENGCGLVYQSCRTKDEDFKVSVQLDAVKIKTSEKKRSLRMKARRSARLAGKDVDSEEKEKVEQKREEQEKLMKKITGSMSNLMDFMKTAPVQPLPSHRCDTVHFVLLGQLFLSVINFTAGTHDGRIATLITSGTQLLDSLSWLSTEGEKSSVSCLSFNQIDTMSEQSRYLCAGYSSGRITIWSCVEQVTQERVVYQELFTCVDLNSSVTLSNWSIFNEGLLVAGSDIGEVVFYKVTSPNTASNRQSTVSLLAKRHCSAASISCATWLENRLCVVGSHDNLIQVLEVSPPVVSTVGHAQQSLITSYFRFSSEHTVTHICTLKGHESFVSSLSMMCGQLVSVGWDSQLLIWPTSDILSAASSSSQALAAGRGRKGRSRQTEKIDLEPTQVFRFGSQRHIRFIPLHLKGVGNSNGGSLMMLTLDGGQRTHSLTAALYTSNKQM